MLKVPIMVSFPHQQNELFNIWVSTLDQLFNESVLPRLLKIFP